jgi:hypothetical protein
MKIFREVLMIQLTIAAFAGIGLASSPISQDETNNAEARYFYVRENSVLLHKSPGIRAKSIARVDSGAICKAVYHIGEWVQVRFDDKREGFIHQSLLSPCLPDPEKSQLNKSLITELVDDSGSDLSSARQRGAEGVPPKNGLWQWIAIISIMGNLLFMGTVLKYLFSRQKALREYMEFRELATVQRSRESLQDEIDTLSRKNKNLEKKIMLLEEKFKKV